MTDARGDVLFEFSEMIDRPAGDVWQAISRVQTVVLPEETAQESRVVCAGHRGLSIRLTDSARQVVIEQRTLSIDDELMVLRMEMAVGQNMPWSTFEARLRVEPLGAYQARITMMCLVTPTAEPQSAEEMLKWMTQMMLEALKRRLMNDAAGRLERTRP